MMQERGKGRRQDGRKQQASGGMAGDRSRCHANAVYGRHTSRVSGLPRKPCQYTCNGTILSRLQGLCPSSILRNVPKGSRQQLVVFYRPYEAESLLYICSIKEQIEDQLPVVDRGSAPNILRHVLQSYFFFLVAGE